MTMTVAYPHLAPFLRYSEILVENCLHTPPVFGTPFVGDHTGIHSVACLFFVGRVQPTLHPSAETFISVQCASPGTGEELVGVCGVRASCVGWRNEQKT